MNILMTEDLLNLSLFRCPACNRRLKYPIMEIGHFGNVCGNCFEKTPYTDAVLNRELCMLMEKLYLPCYYAEDGCTFHGSFRKTYEHEKRCRFRTVWCPYVYQNKCENLLVMNELVSHINENHGDNILIVEDGCIMLENPSNNNRECLYFFEIDENYFLALLLFDKEGQKILYAFYRLNDTNTAKAVKFHSVAFNETRENHVKHKFELMYKFDLNNFFSADLRMLLKFNFTQKIKVSIQTDNVFSNNVNVDGFKRRKVWFQCQNCFEMYSKQHVCINCRINVITCSTTCRPFQMCQKCGSGGNNVHTISLINNIVSSEFICRSEGCNEVVPGDIYNIHQNFQCRFKTHKCSFCNEEHTVQDMIKHILLLHKSVLNPKVCTIVLNKTTKYAFINDVDVFILSCSVSSQKILTVTIIKLTEPYWDNSFAWKLHIKLRENTAEAIILGDCNMSGNCKQIDVSEFMVKENLTCTLYITNI